MRFYFQVSRFYVHVAFSHLFLKNVFLNKGMPITYKFILKLAGSTSVTASALTNLVCICRLFVKYLSGKTFGDQKVKPETLADLGGRWRGLLTPLVGKFLS